MTTITPDEMKKTLRLWASGVTIAATANDQKQAGTTVSSFTSVSLEPPLILICLYHELETLKQIQQNRCFAISMLGETQSDVSSQMAGLTDLPADVDRFYGLDWTTAETGAPILSDALGWLDCTLHAVYDGGTHKIVLGKIVATGQKEQQEPPLIYHNRNYRYLKND